jgi:hypothetical protein
MRPKLSFHSSPESDIILHDKTRQGYVRKYALKPAGYSFPAPEKASRTRTGPQ